MKKFNEFREYDCSTWKCKRKVIGYEWGDHWCIKDRKRVQRLRQKDGRDYAITRTPK